MWDDTNVEDEHFASFILMKTYPFWFTAHLFAGYDIVRLWVSGFPANTDMKITNCECLPFSFWLPGWLYLHTMLAWGIETHPRFHSWVFFFLIASLLYYFSSFGSSDVFCACSGSQQSQLWSSCDNLDILCIHLHWSGCILILVWFYVVSELIQCYFRLTSSMDAISHQNGLQIKFSSLYTSRGSVRGNIGNKFHSLSHPLESYVIYNWNSIIISAQKAKKNDDIHFFFEPLAATNHLGSGPAFWSWHPLWLCNTMSKHSCRQHHHAQHFHHSLQTHQRVHHCLNAKSPWLPPLLSRGAHHNHTHLF